MGDIGKYHFNFLSAYCFLFRLHYKRQLTPYAYTSNLTMHKQLIDLSIAISNLPFYAKLNSFDLPDPYLEFDMDLEFH